jgi:hypothetical protein
MNTFEVIFLIDQNGLGDSQKGIREWGGAAINGQMGPELRLGSGFNKKRSVIEI